MTAAQDGPSTEAEWGRIDDTLAQAFAMLKFRTPDPYG